MWFKARTRCISPLLALAITACQALPDAKSQGDSDGEDAGDGDDENKLRDDPDVAQETPDDPDKPSGNNSDKHEPFAPPEPQLRALLASQYTASVRDILGEKAARKAKPPSDPSPINGFASIGASQLSIDSAAVEKYEASAVAIAAEVAKDSDSIEAIAGCTPKKNAQACLTSFVQALGLRLFRRPLSQEEQERYASLVPDANYETRIALVVTAMLQSPFFLYQIEAGLPVEGDSEKRKLSGYEMATRISYFLLGTTPSPELLAAAKAGELDSAKGIRAVATEMLEDPKARAAMKHYWYEILELSHVDAASKDPDLFKDWTESMATSVRQETLTFLDKVIWEGSGKLKEIWTADYTYANQDIAKLYGLPSKGMGKDFARVALPEDSKRGGLLGQASFLAAVSHSTTTSPTLRGKMVMEKFLCVTIPAPPPEAATEFKPGSGKAKTKIELLKEHVEDPSCQGCHQFMDPIGLGLENFDSIGRFRFEENGVVLHTEHDAATLGRFDGPAELGALIAEDERSSDCFTRSLFRFATGHIESDGEQGAIADLVRDFDANKQDIPSLLVELVSSPAFRYVGTHNE